MPRMDKLVQGKCLFICSNPAISHPYPVDEYRTYSLRGLHNTPATPYQAERTWTVQACLHARESLPPWSHFSQSWTSRPSGYSIQINFLYSFCFARGIPICSRCLIVSFRLCTYILSKLGISLARATFLCSLRKKTPHWSNPCLLEGGNTTLRCLQALPANLLIDIDFDTCKDTRGVNFASVCI